MDIRGWRTRALDVGIEPNGADSRTTTAQNQDGAEDAALPTPATGRADDNATGGGIPEPEPTVEATTADPAEAEVVEIVPIDEPEPAETPEEAPVANEDTEIVETPDAPVGSAGDDAPADGDEVGETGSAPRVTRATLVTDAEDPAAKPVTAFRSRLDEVYVVGEVADAPEDTELSVEWILTEAPGEDDYEYNSDRYVDTTIEIDGDRPFSFHLEHDDPLPAGSYIVELSLDGVVAEKLEFSVYEPAPPA